MYDYCLTITREVKQFWRGELSLATVLFGLNRYAAFIAVLSQVLDLIDGRQRLYVCPVARHYGSAL